MVAKTLQDIIHDKLTIEELMRGDDEKQPADARQVGGSHYKEMDPQPWDVMQALLTPEEFQGYLKGNMIKYAMRQGKKDSPDAGKYRHYTQKLQEFKKSLDKEW